MGDAQDLRRSGKRGSRGKVSTLKVWGCLGLLCEAPSVEELSAGVRLHAIFFLVNVWVCLDRLLVFSY